MQEVGINLGTPPIARRPEGTSRFELIFEGTRDAKVRDRHTRVHISLPSTLTAQLWHQLAGHAARGLREDGGREAGATARMAADPDGFPWFEEP
ncbi:MAG: hypothetical protein LC797_25550 [Chloroflexi bacterium]|nr:hypothetical protein [Chloroflexota bacterium]